MGTKAHRGLLITNSSGPHVPQNGEEYAKHRHRVLRDTSRSRLLFMLPLLLALDGCSCRLSVPAAEGQIQKKEPLVLYERPIHMRIFKPQHAAADNVLILYATGDGGWLGLGGEIFDWMTQWNYPVAGFSSREYLKNLAYDADTTTPRRLVRDYERMIAFAESRLELPAASTSVILVGLSRGAGLSVVAAGQGQLGPRLAGLLAIALTKEEEHVIRYRTRRPAATNAPRRVQIEIQTYSYLNRVSSFPAMVLQSTHDGYLPAEEARQLFGPDTELHKLHPIEAANHTFRNGCQALYDETASALKWIAGFRTAGHPSKSQGMNTGRQ
jgi:hypothetical protein